MTIFREAGEQVFPKPMTSSELILMHEGVLRKSGRYPWGSGKDPHQRNKMFLDYVEDLQNKGMSPTEIAKGMGLEDEDGISTTQLRALKTIAKAQNKAQDISKAQRMKESGDSNMAIGRAMGINESSVRALLDPAAKAKNDEIFALSNLLRDEVSADRYIDVGAGVERHLGISKEKLTTAVAMLEEEGYKKYPVKIDQPGGKETTMKILAPPGTPYREVFLNQDRIKNISKFSEDRGDTFKAIEPPVSVSLKRVGVRYAEEGGTQKDGVIELRRGVPDISLGNSRYAQVRIAVEGTHYLKGMAMYSDDLPDGVDMLFNTNKKSTGNKLDAMKSLVNKKTGKVDEDNPFGSIVRQKHYVDSKGNTKLSPLNIVGTKDPDGVKTPGEEGAWYQWSRNLSSQMMSKQGPHLAQKQLDLSYDIKKAEFDLINSLDNPAVKKRLLKSFADDAESSSVKLSAAGLPRTRNHVILPINSLKDTEIYAPNFNNGEKVVLVRHPHGGIFEIPELTVNNRNAEANRLIPNAKDAVGINAKVAERLSGADFDGDTVLVIPNKQSGPDRVRTAPAVSALIDFDPKRSYPKYEGMPEMANKQQEMGKISNLITDMTIRRATNAEIVRAVRHSMVVIDAEKHELNYKQSAIDHGIKELKQKYQSKPDGKSGGASTIISRASSDVRVGARKPRPAKEGGPIDKATGKKVWEYSGETYIKTTTTKNGVVKEKLIPKTVKSKRMLEEEDAFNLSSGQPIEAVYATHANKLKALANEARRIDVNTPGQKVDYEAKAKYGPQIKSLDAKLDIAMRNAPLERQALLLAKAKVKAKRQADPEMKADEIKKLNALAVQEARQRVGASKKQVQITDDEWEAIQAGAISNNKLTAILDNADLDSVKARATPRTATVMVPAKVARAKAMLANGYTSAEVASMIGVPVSTLNSALDR